MARETGDLLQGTLGTADPQGAGARGAHGYGIARWIEDTTGDVLQIEEGSLYPGAAAAGGPRLHRVALGALREQPPRPLLRDQARRREAPRGAGSSWTRFARAVLLVLEAEPAAIGGVGR